MNIYSFAEYVNDGQIMDKNGDFIILCLVLVGSTSVNVMASKDHKSIFNQPPINQSIKKYAVAVLIYKYDRKHLGNFPH